MEFDNRTVMITGATRGIGRAIADRLYEEGAQLSLPVRGSSAFVHGYDERRCIVIEGVDVRNETALKLATSSTVDRFGTIDVLVNNAGVDVPRPLSRIDAAHLHDVMSVNFYSAVLLTKLVSAVMVERHRGKIVNVSSIAGKEGSPHHIAYSASKHALIGFTKCAARELIKHGVVVNAVCPGLVDTRMLRNFFDEFAEQTGSSPERELHEMLARTPRAQLGDPSDVADLVAFLASDRSRNIVGQAINTDGGLLQW